MPETIIYSRKPMKSTRTVHPRYFIRPLAGVRCVVVVGDAPRVVEAYKRAGVEVVEVGAADDVPAIVGADPTEAIMPLSHNDECCLAITSEPHTYFVMIASGETLKVPADFRELPWSRPEEPGGLTMRGLVAQLGLTANTKDEAIAAIEAVI